MFSATRNAAMGATALTLAAGLSLPTQAAYTVTLVEQGGNVVATGSGSLDVTALSLNTAGFVEVPFINPSNGDLYVGPTSGTGAVYNGTLSGPSNFGGGGGNASGSGSGDVGGIAFGIPGIVVPVGYVSGDPLSGDATWGGATFASLGVTPGTYVWTWGTAADADSFTVLVGGTVGGLHAGPNR